LCICHLAAWAVLHGDAELLDLGAVQPEGVDPLSPGVLVQGLVPQDRRLGGGGVGDGDKEENIENDRTVVRMGG
jgi:hypothetical protein